MVLGFGEGVQVSAFIGRSINELAFIVDELLMHPSIRISVIVDGYERFIRIHPYLSHTGLRKSMLPPP